MAGRRSLPPRDFRGARPQLPRSPRADLPKPPRDTPAAPQTYTPIVCPFCGARFPKRTKTDTEHEERRYRCRRCSIDGDKGSPFKVRIGRLDGRLEALDPDRP